MEKINGIEKHAGKVRKKIIYITNLNQSFKVSIKKGWALLSTTCQSGVTSQLSKKFCATAWKLGAKFRLNCGKEIKTINKYVEWKVGVLSGLKYPVIVVTPQKPSHLLYTPI